MMLKSMKLYPAVYFIFERLLKKKTDLKKDLFISHWAGALNNHMISIQF